MAGRAMSLADLHVVAGQDAETARVDPERLVEAVFGAEVGDRAAELVGVAALEPMAGAVGHVCVELGQDVVVLGQELGVVEQARPLGRAADHGDRVAIARPGRPVDEVEQAAGARVPGPVEVVGESPEAFEPRREREAGGRDRRHADGVHEPASYPLAIRVNRFSGAAPDGVGVRWAALLAHAPWVRSLRCSAPPSPHRGAAILGRRRDGVRPYDALRMAMHVVMLAPSASRGPRPAAWPTWSTPLPARWAR